MSKALEILNEIIKALNLKQLLFSIMIVLGLVIVPRVNFLNFLLPFDDAENIAILIFSVLIVFFIIEFLKAGVVTIKSYLKKQKEVERCLDRLEEEINNLTIQQKRILLRFIESNNQPMQLNEGTAYESSLISNYNFLYEMPDSNIGRFNYDCYDYKIHLIIYRRLLKLYKKKRIFSDIKTDKEVTP